MISPQFQSALDQEEDLIISKAKLLDKTLKQSSERKKQDLLAIQLFEETIQNCGLIRGEWMRQNRLQSICYGSGVAISKRIVLTCAHSIFHDDKSLVCDIARFIPDHKEGKLKSQEKVYSSSSQSSIKLKALRRGEKFGKSPISEDLALVYLSQDLGLDSFPQVGVEEVVEIPEKSSIMACGYPSLGYYRCADLHEIDFRRAPLYGQFVSIIGSTIFHCLDTKTGHSGSPIFGVSSKTGYPAIIGVHTHKGKNKNSGVFLNYANLKRLARYEIQLGLAHPEYQMGIKFPQTIKIEVWNQLSLKQRKQFRNRKLYYQTMNGSQEGQQQLDVSDQQNSSQRSDMQDYYKQDINVCNSDFNELLTKNMRLTEKIVKDLPYNVYKKVLFQWLLIERDALPIFRQLVDKSSKKHPKSNKICFETKINLANFQKELLQAQAIFGRSDQIQIFRCKFPQIQEKCPRYDIVS